jgi:hypothetical protein
LRFSSSVFLPKPKLDHGKEPQAEPEVCAPALLAPALKGTSSSESKAVEAVEAPEPKPW